MGITCRKITVGVWEGRLILDRNAQFWDCLFETSAEEQRGTDQECGHFRRARAEAQGDLTMLDRQIRLAGPQLEKTADVPAARVARIEGERTPRTLRTLKSDSMKAASTMSRGCSGRLSGAGSAWPGLVDALSSAAA